jgi:5-methylcytosine-specific restriction endonuclease McrA
MVMTDYSDLMRTHAERVAQLRANLLDQVVNDFITTAQYSQRMARADLIAARRISGSERAQIIDDADGICEYCNREAATKVDHCLPVSKCGTGDRSNLKAACRRCNDDKFDQTPDEWRSHRLAQGLVWPPDWHAELKEHLRDRGLLPSQRVTPH